MFGSSIAPNMGVVQFGNNEHTKEGMMQVSDTLIKMVPYLVPFIILEGILLVVSLIDLAKRQYVTGGNKIVWIAVIVGLQAIGPIIYLVAGRKEEKVESD